MNHISKFVDDYDNCSIVQIIDNEVYILGRGLYNTTDYSITETDRINDRIHFYIREREGPQSLDQSPGVHNRFLKVHDRTAREVWQAFREVDKENERRIQRLFKA